MQVSCYYMARRKDIRDSKGRLEGVLYLYSLVVGTPRHASVPPEAAKSVDQGAARQGTGDPGCWRRRLLRRVQ